jgi:hypothetical protein
MSRTYFLAGVLIIFVMLNWIITIYFADRLPQTLPLNFFGDKPYAIKGPHNSFYFFPVVITAVALVFLLLMPVRGKIPFPGRRRLAAIPAPYREAITERFYQILLVVALFITLLLSYLQASMALYSTNAINEMRIWPVYAAGAVFLIYLVYNLLMLSRLICRMSELEERGGEEFQGRP